MNANSKDKTQNALVLPEMMPVMNLLSQGSALEGSPESEPSSSGQHASLPNKAAQERAVETMRKACPSPAFHQQGSVRPQWMTSRGLRETITQGFMVTSSAHTRNPGTLGLQRLTAPITGPQYHLEPTRARGV